ncbi:TIGR00266 family protein [Corallincola holothuriorum]|uniref:TIGR00266 family protein n=1 Tax=Corallincola holothuriorum TaxID=2282215 RepID=A0A368NG58_9GAMM|nr:TIGR00266 family protein [Corallincola holothuriorum]RCU49552.1 TIGR00266 family protein [Corallincola holothuriorum]
MKAEIKGSQAFSYIDVDLEPGETIVSESDAMSSMDADLDLTATFNGGFFRGLLKKYLGGETLFVSRFTNNTNANKRVTLVQPVPGEIRCIELNDEEFHLQPGAYLASSDGVELGLRWAGFVSFIAREGLFKLTVKGTGKVFYGAYGALVEKEVDGEYIVDTSHLVAYEPGIKLKLQLAGGIFSSFFGGEGLVTRVQGKGKIIVQTRSLSGLSSWLNPKFR